LWTFYQETFMAKKMVNVTAMICAGGSGSRFGAGELPKQFLMLAGKPILARTLRVFEDLADINTLVIVSHPDHIERCRQVAKEEKIKKLVAVVGGGATRQESVYNGLQAVQGHDDDIIAIHDAVRPLVTPQVILDSIEAAILHGSADVVTPTIDTIIVAENGFIQTIPDRRTLRNEQTPQTFRLGLIRQAHEHARQKGLKDVSDDVQLVLAMGHPVKLVEGPGTNIKITTRQDLALAELLITEEGNKK
jgi:2-C-methyl-D-erythritol 4-phosphate cytidylyltransferase